ncbi:MAG: isochorismate synthase [bacterium]
MRPHSAVEFDARALDVAERLRRAADHARRKARSLRRPVLAWAATQISPIDPLRAFAYSDASHRILWARPAEQFRLLGIGSAWTSSPKGPGRFEQAAAAWSACVDDAVSDDTDRSAVGAGPLALAGFSFLAEAPAGPEWDSFPSAAVVVPRLSVCNSGDACWLSVAVTVEPGERAEVDETMAHLRTIVDAAGRGSGDGAAEAGGGPPVLDELPLADRWKAAVGRAAQAVRDGQLRKIVLARAINVTGLRARPATALRRLSADYPNCAIFAVARGDRCFLGATPERLVRIRDSRVNTAAVAGSAPRGGTPDEDERLGEALLKNPKDRLEHAVVVDMLREVISEACDDVTTAVGPTLLKVANIQHLETALAGRLRERLSILELAGRLHPTPAVGGLPRDRALGWMREHEELERGWYAGPVGWIDRRGEGEFAVAIRSALMHGNRARLFAGCGIVADSDPDQEYAESWLKLRPMLSALGVNDTGVPAARFPGASRGEVL